ncbi:MAG: Spy/CpxP family protein refolding chaperone [bacterium]
MKVLNLTLIAMISQFIISCSSKDGLDPISAESTVLNKTSLSSQDEDLLPFLNRGWSLWAVLDLTEEQKAQIKEIIQSQRVNFKFLRGSFESRPSFEERKAKRNEMRESIHKEILAILTPEQRAKAEELKAQLERGEVPEELLNKRIEVLSAKLNLNEEQKSQIKALGFWQTLLSMKAESANRREFLQKRRELLKENKEKMLNILTPEQQSIFLEIKGQRQEKMKKRFQRFGRNRSQKRIERLSVALDLDETQKAQLQKIFADVRGNIRGELNGNHNGRNREELLQAMREKMSQVDKQIQSILNAKQLEKYAELKTARQGRR